MILIELSLESSLKNKTLKGKLQIFQFLEHKKVACIFQRKNKLLFNLLRSPPLQNNNFSKCAIWGRLRIFFVSYKSYVLFSKYSSFCIFNHPVIYQICDVMMSISTWDGGFLNISFEPQLFNPSNLAN